MAVRQQHSFLKDSDICSGRRIASSTARVTLPLDYHLRNVRWLVFCVRKGATAFKTGTDICTGASLNGGPFKPRRESIIIRALALP